jgi:ATP-dependent DNA helicase RecQ
VDRLAALREHFGFQAFRPGQEEAVAAALAGRDALVVMPTGAGKSLCYQLPALMREDLTLVVSPLVSLMQDQVEALERVAPGRAALVNAQQDAETNRRAVDRAVDGEVRLLYVAPERFSSRGFYERLQRADVGLFVVDEAHCVSQWGHDFRPDYFRLADAARALGAKAIMASTATATPQVAADIATRLGLRDAVKVTTGFDRPNLTFAVVPCRTTADKHGRIAAALGEPGARPAIVYAGTRKGTDALAGTLSSALGIEVPAYHAGLGREQRAAVQRRFMAGEVEVVVATNAFGMGIDKADVRTVCHETVPGSLEAYYQEAGRAGRDGAPARALLFAEGRDKGLHVFFIERSKVDDALMLRIASRLAARASEGRYDVTVGELVAQGCEEDAVRSIVGHLARAGVVQPAPSTPDRLRGRVLQRFDGRAAAACRSSAGEAERVRWRQYRSIWGFVEGTACRRGAILRHFGDRAAPAPADGVACCDVCVPEIVPAEPARRGKAGALAAARDIGELDAAILEVVETAKPVVGRTGTVEILRGSRSKKIQRNSYDGLPAYGAFAHLRADDVLTRVDAMVEEGRLRLTGGAYPTLRAGDAAAA